MMRAIVPVLTSERGVTAIEYAAIVAVLIVAGIAALRSTGDAPDKGPEAPYQQTSYAA